MLTTSSAPPAPEVSAPLALQQLYITYCLYGEGVRPEAGFSVRAASTRDPLLLRFACEYPPYESPDGGGADTPAAPEEFARLALARIPGGPAALLHTVAHPGAGGRVNNFFTHVVSRPALTARDALSTWASPGWVSRCPRRHPKELPALDGLPSPGPLDDGAITAFLRPKPGAGPSPFCPDRLADADRRRELLSQVLRGCLLALQAGPSSPRARFYLRAEPSLTALLFYAAARILPPRPVSGMTFTTHEAPFALRAYRQTQLVGTWSADPSDALDDSFYLTRGYALDTVSRRASPELMEPAHPIIAEWIDLAADGEWKVLDGLYSLMGETAESLVSVRQAFQAARQTRLFVSGRAAAGDVLALKHSPDGAALLARHRDKVREVLLGADLSDPALRHELADLLPESELRELEQTVAHALQGGLAEGWQKPWQLLKVALRSNPERLRETLPRILPPPPFPAGLRVALLRELLDLDLPASRRKCLHPALRGCTPEELGEFAGSGLPPEWFALALCYSLMEREAQAEAVRLLLGGGDELFRAFWGQLDQVKDERQRRGILAPLLAPARGPGALFLGRSLQNRCGIRVETLEWILAELDALTPGWSDFWRADDRLRHLLDGLLERGEEAGPIWNRLARQITADVLLGDSHQGDLLANLRVALERDGNSIPESASRLVADWASLREHFISASAVPAGERQPILDACLRLGLAPVDLLRHYFERYLSAREMGDEQLADFAGFFHSFSPEPSWYEDHERRFAGWLTVVGACADEGRRAAYQGYYLAHQVPEQLRERLREETRKAGRLLPGAAGPRPAAAAAPSPEKPAATPAVAAPASGASSYAPGIDEGGPASVAALVRSAAWMLVGVAGGFVAAILVGLGSLPARTVAVLAPFLPLVTLAADGAALYACAVTGRALRRRDRASAHVNMASAGAGVGGAAAVLGVCASLALGRPLMAAVWLGVTVFSAVVAGVVAGAGLPWVASAAGLRNRVAVGPLARAVAVAAATGAFVFLAGWLLP